MSAVARLRLPLTVALALALAGLVMALPSAATPAATRASAAAEAGAAPAARAHPPSRRSPAPVRPGEVLVRFAPRATALRRSRALGGQRATGLVGGGVRRVAVPAGTEAAAAARLERDPAVAWAEPNYVRTAFQSEDPELSWGLEAIQTAPVWNGGITGEGVRVAILDSGVDRSHGQLRGRVVNGLDVFDTGGRDDCGHGTAVAGIAGAARDQVSIAGAAPAVTIVPVKVLAYDEAFDACVGDDSAIVAGIRWAADPAAGNADIINLSLGGPQYSEAIAEAVREAVSHGVLVVAASGNAGDRIPSYPAALPGVISVGGLERSDTGPRWWSASSFGSVDIAAPARDVPVILAGGVDAERLGAVPCPDDVDQPLCGDGTSFSAPYVAGVAALLVELHPELVDLSPLQRVARLRQWLLGTTETVDGSEALRYDDLQTGHGLVLASRAAAASIDPTRTLLTWKAKQRVIAPRDGLLAVPHVTDVTAVLTDGHGNPLRGRTVLFQTAGGGRTADDAQTTDRRGEVTTEFRSRAAGRVSAVTASAEALKLRLDLYVLEHDDNVRGARPPASPISGALDVVIDSDDVFRLYMREGETLRAELNGVDRRTEYIDMWVFGPGVRDVTTGDPPPMQEDTEALELDPLRLRRRMPADGWRYLDVFGIGTYTLTWVIYSPGRVRDMTASRSTFTPDGDGVADRTRFRWRVKTPGKVVLRIRDSDRRVVRLVDYGKEPERTRSFRWNGRDSSGKLLPSGRYRATAHWRGGNGRISKTSTRVTLQR